MMSGDEVLWTVALAGGVAAGVAALTATATTALRLSGEKDRLATRQGEDLALMRDHTGAIRRLESRVGGLEQDHVGRREMELIREDLRDLDGRMDELGRQVAVGNAMLSMMSRKMGLSPDGGGS